MGQAGFCGQDRQARIWSRCLFSREGTSPPGWVGSSVASRCQVASRVLKGQHKAGGAVLSLASRRLNFCGSSGQLSWVSGRPCCGLYACDSSIRGHAGPGLGS